MAIIQVKISPRASKNALEGWQGDTLRIRLHALPEKGQANIELISFLSETFDVPKSNIRLVSGQSSRLKRVEIQGRSLEEIHCMSNK
jgi:uncharacterized protein (TIGR00251 family)